MEPIPPSLNLSGQAVIPVGCGQQELAGGCYEPYPDSYSSELSDLNGPLGTATITWNLTPVFAASSCPVDGGGLTTAWRSESPWARAAQETPCAPKLYTDAEKTKFADQALDAYRKHAEFCGASEDDPLTWLRLHAPVPFWHAYCALIGVYADRMAALVLDPPASHVGVVALPVVAPPPPGGRCRLAAAACRGGPVVLAYVRDSEFRGGGDERAGAVDRSDVIEPGGAGEPVGLPAGVRAPAAGGGGTPVHRGSGGVV